MFKLCVLTIIWPWMFKNFEQLGLSVAQVSELYATHSSIWIHLTYLTIMICLSNMLFRSQTSDMERWKAEKRRVEERKRKSQKKIQWREMLGKSQNTETLCFSNAKHGFKSKCKNPDGYGPLLEDQMSKKVHAAVARSTNVQTHHHFWKVGCRKMARYCDAKHMSKSKCTKHTMPGPLLEDRQTDRQTDRRIDR